MSKTIKDMIVREYKKRFTGVEGAVLVELRGMAGTDNTGLRLKMHAKQVRVTVVKNALARKAFEGTALEVLAPGLSGPTAVVYGGDSVVGIARDLVKMAKDQEALVLKGACIDGTWFGGDAGVKRLSEFPTKEEAQAKVVTLVLSPARKLMGAVKGPGGCVMGIVKEIESRLEKGETIAAKAG